MSAGQQQHRLGGLDVSVVGLGCNNFGDRLDQGGTVAVVRAALGAGVNFFDTADIYGGLGGSERLLGEALAGRRDQVVIATKFGMNMEGTDGAPDAPRGSARYVRAACDASLRRLRTDWIDLYQYHFPDGVTPIGETLTALAELVAAGKIRYSGCCNFSAQHLEHTARVAEEDGLIGFVSIQNEYSLLWRAVEADIVPACRRLGVGVVPYYPLAGGLLTGKYLRNQPAPPGTRLYGRDPVTDPATFDRLETLRHFAAAHELELIDVAIGWLAAQPTVASVIAGATKPEQVLRNVRAGCWQPSQADLDELNAISPPP